MRHFGYTIIIFTLLMMFTQYGYAQDKAAENKGNLSGQIESIYQEMGAAVQAKDAAAFAEFFAEDVYFKLPGQKAVESRMGVQKIHEGMFAQGMSIRPQTTELQEYGNIAVEVGTVDILAPDGSVAAKAVYLTNWKKIDGEWLIYRDVVSGSPMQ